MPDYHVRVQGNVSFVAIITARDRGRAEYTARRLCSQIRGPKSALDFCVDATGTMAREMDPPLFLHPGDLAGWGGRWESTVIRLLDSVTGEPISSIMLSPNWTHTTVAEEVLLHTRRDLVAAPPDWEYLPGIPRGGGGWRDGGLGAARSPA